MSAEFISPAIAAVRPRVFSEYTHEPVLLEDLVRACMGHSERALEIVGEAGSGKSMALAHLAALPDADRLYICDDYDAAQLPSVPGGKLFVFAGRGRTNIAARRCRLSPWTTDDLIEYTLHTSPSRCSSVAARFKEGSGIVKLGGNPQLICLVAEELFRRDELTVQEALERALERITPDSLRSTASAYAMAALMGQYVGDIDLSGLHDCPVLSRTLFQRVVRIYFAAQHCAALLRANANLPPVVPHDLVEAIAGSLAQDGSMSANLRSRMESPKRRENLAMEASVLHRLDPAWTPASIAGRRIVLNDGYFEHAEWSRIRLTRVSMCGADLRDADLSGASFVKVDLSEARLQNANLRAASMTQCVACRANLDHADLEEAQLDKSDFQRADFTGANLKRISVRQSDMSDANFQQSDLSEGDFRSSNLNSANLAETNLAGANFENASLQAVKLGDAKLDNTNFRHALLQCNLEFATIEQCCFEAATLSGSIFTGSRMHGGQLLKAKLVGCGLADIDWEQVDLRWADLTNCSFHLGSTRSGLVGSPYPSHGTRTGFYTDEFDANLFKTPEEVRKANLRGANLIGAIVRHTDFYLVDLREAVYDAAQESHFRNCRAILDDWST